MAASAHFSPYFSLGHTTRSYPRLPYEQIKNDLLGRPYSLSLVFVGPGRARALNRKNRKKTYVPNVLSFPLDDSHGEIFITPQIAKKEAKRRGMTTQGYVGYLFIHALLHLKGGRHGDTMDTLERQYCTKYNLK